jgi:hypothetical protein
MRAPISVEPPAGYATMSCTGLMGKFCCARHVVQRRPWSTAQQPISEDWWADVLADSRARQSRQPRGFYGNDRKPAARGAHYSLADKPCSTILVACRKCDWKAAFIRVDLIATHGADYPLPDLLYYLAAPGCPKIRDHWDRCGGYYVKPTE